MVNVYVCCVVPVRGRIKPMAPRRDVCVVNEIKTVKYELSFGFLIAKLVCLRLITTFNFCYFA